MTRIQDRPDYGSPDQDDPRQRIGSTQLVSLEALRHAEQRERNPGVTGEVEEMTRFRAFVLSLHGSDRNVIDEVTGLTVGDLATVLYILETPCQLEHAQRRPPNPGRVADPAWPGLFRRATGADYDDGYRDPKASAT